MLDVRVFSLAPGGALFKNAPATAKTRSLVEPLLSLWGPYESGSSLGSSPSTSPTLPSRPLPADMHREEERLKTFEKWPITFITPQALARSGFYYLGRNDEVRCAFCKVEIMRWVEGDDPAVEHQRWAPQCSFLRKQKAADTQPAGPVTVEQDKCVVRTPPPADASVCMPGPAHPRYASEASRLRTFKDWPRSMKQTPEELAEAGFYYTGLSDKTKCFYCDGGLKDWEEDDVPWEQHARWFDRCAYVLLVKGKDYVKKVISDSCVVPETKTAPKRVAARKPKAKEEKEPEVEDSKVCKTCYDNERNVCFVPCGHVVACAKCALATDKCALATDKCPMYRGRSRVPCACVPHETGPERRRPNLVSGSPASGRAEHTSLRFPGTLRIKAKSHRRRAQQVRLCVCVTCLYRMMSHIVDVTPDAGAGRMRARHACRTR